MIKISRSNTNWLTRGDEAVNLGEAKKRLAVLVSGLGDPKLAKILHFNVYVEPKEITFTAMDKRSGAKNHTKFEGSVGEIRVLAKLLPKNDKSVFVPIWKGRSSD